VCRRIRIIVLAITKNIPHAKQILTNSLHKAFRNGDEIQGFVRQDRVQSSIVVILAGVKQAV
jgi:hypothetical protein